jgi:O-antigen ligase
LNLIGQIKVVNLLCAVAALILPLAVFAHKGVAVLFALAALAALVVAARGGLGTWQLPSALTLPLVGFVAWSALSAAWSLSPADSLYQTAVLAAVAGGGLALAHVALGFASAERRRVRRCLIGGFIAALVLVSIESLSGNFLIRLYDPQALTSIINNGAAALAVFFWPVMLALRAEAGWRPAAVVAIATLAALSTTPSLSAALGPLIGLAVIAVLWLWPKMMPRALIVLLGIGVFAAPFLPQFLPDPQRVIARNNAVGYTVAPRIFIWRNTAARIAEKPVTGWGLNSSRFFYGDQDKVSLGATTIEPIPLHPHNGILQWWLELGAIGAAFGAAVLMALLAAIARLPSKANRRGAAATLFTTLFIASISYGVWQGWWIGIYWFAAIFLVAIVEPGPAENDRGRRQA